MKPSANEHTAPLKMKCPSCGIELGDFPTLEESPLKCPKCEYSIFWDGSCWDACVDKTYRRDFARQWVLWEAGKLGDPKLVYGSDPKSYFREFLDHMNLTEENLKSMRILEVGFGHGRLLHQIQSICPMAYGLDLSRPLKSAQLRPGSAIFANLFNIPLMPHQFDLVICRGVIHVTPDAQKAFACVAEQVADNGLLYIAGLYEPGRPLLLLRKIFPQVWNYPESVRLGISSFFGALLAVKKAFKDRTFGLATFKNNYQFIKINVFDHIAPKWTSVHMEDEVIGWFASRGFLARKVGTGHYCGEKPGARQKTSQGSPAEIASNT